MRWPTRTLVGIMLAGMAGAAVVLERRRTRRAAAAASRGDRGEGRRWRVEGGGRGYGEGGRSKVEGGGRVAATPSSTFDPPPSTLSGEPLLSPTRFTVTHFGMLAILLTMMIVGLSMRGIRRYPPENTWYVNGGDVERGRQVLVAHGCGGCHVIPGISGATGQVGPPLEGFAQRMYIGGQLPNTPDNLIAWLQDPQRYAPGTAMPNLPISEPAARDMAAYLYANP